LMFPGAYIFLHVQICRGTMLMFIKSSRSAGGGWLAKPVAAQSPLPMISRFPFALVGKVVVNKSSI
jgi:hypothetical protein